MDVLDAEDAQACGLVLSLFLPNGILLKWMYACSVDNLRRPAMIRRLAGLLGQLVRRGVTLGCEPDDFHAFKTIVSNTMRLSGVKRKLDHKLLKKLALLLISTD